MGKLHSPKQHVPNSKLTQASSHPPGKSEISHSGPIPAGVSKEKAVSVMHDHIGFFKAADTFREQNETPNEAKPDKVPADIKTRSVGGSGDVKAYTIRNEVPNSFFDSNVTSTYNVVDLEDGLWYYATSPMGVTNTAVWEVKEAGNGLELRVTLQVECSVMLKSVVKGQVTSSVQQIHKTLVERMKE